jgi:hypothetical protein
VNDKVIMAANASSNNTFVFIIFYLFDDNELNLKSKVKCQILGSPPVPPPPPSFVFGATFSSVQAVNVVARIEVNRRM